jgi:hypothetical protein
MHSICADKLKVRQVVRDRVGEKYLIPLIFNTENPSDIRAEILPDYPVILKLNHDSGGGIIVDDKNSADYPAIRAKLKSRMAQNYYLRGREPEYKSLKPRILVEKLMQDQSRNKLLNDYKIYCFDGIPYYIQTLRDRESGIKEDWYDLDWNHLDMRYYSDRSAIMARPTVFFEMLEIAKKLSEGFSYVRVDLYEVNGAVFFGELTFHPYSGFMHWKPESWDAKLGKLLKINA